MCSCIYVLQPCLVVMFCCCLVYRTCASSVGFVGDLPAVLVSFRETHDGGDCKCSKIFLERSPSQLMSYLVQAHVSLEDFYISGG